MGRMMRVLRKQRGLTVVELVVALAILGIVLTLGYHVSYSTYRAFDRAEQQSIVQRDMRIALEYITREVRVAHALSIIDGLPPALGAYESDAGNDSAYIYYDEDRKAIIHLFKDDGGKAHERKILDAGDDGFDYSLTFYRGTDSAGNALSSAILHVLIQEGKTQVDLSTNTIANNVLAVSGSNVRSTIRYDTEHIETPPGAPPPPEPTPEQRLGLLGRVLRLLVRLIIFVEP